MIEITNENIKAILHTLGEGVSDSEIEQVRSAADFGKVTRFFTELVGSLSKKQRIALVEEIGLSVVEWVDFDIDDTKTFPMTLASIMTNNGLRRFGKIKGIYCFTKERQTHVGSKTVVDNGVTHWCELPQRKESKL